MNERKIYKKQLQISTLKFAVEVPEFITIALSAVFSRSIIVWMDFVESLGNLINMIKSMKEVGRPLLFILR